MSTPIGRSGVSRLTPAANAAGIVLSSPTKVGLFDDFLGDVIADQWNYVEGTDTAPADAAILAGGVGGILRIAIGDAGTGLAADLCHVTTALQWRAANGGLAAETRVKMNAAITNAYFFFGFTDQAGTLEGPVVSAASADTLTSNASDAVGFMFDTRMTTDNIWLVGVKADTDAVAQDSALAFVADQFVTLRVEVSELGVASFFINGVGVGSTMANAVTAATALTPIVACGNTSGTVAKTVDVDYVHVAMNRAANGAAY